MITEFLYTSFWYPFNLTAAVEEEEATMNIDRARELYVNLAWQAEKEIRPTHHGDDRIQEICGEIFAKLGDETTQIGLGMAIQNWRIKHKAACDAYRNVLDTEYYLGAPDDNGDEDDGRCTFALHAEKIDRLDHALALALDAARELLRVWPRDSNDMANSVITMLHKEIKDYDQEMEKRKALKKTMPRKSDEAAQRVDILAKARAKAKESNKSPSPIPDAPKEREAKLPSPSDDSIGIDLSGEWVGKWMLGQGSYGTASLWVLRTVHNTIGHRVVLKEIQDSKDWNEEQLWTKGDTDVPDNIPVEIQCHLNFRGKEGSSGTVHMWNWNLHKDDRYYRQYLEFCPHGDLWDLIDGYQEAGNDKIRSIYKWTKAQKDAPYDDHRNTRTLIPEPFLWHLFEVLVKAGLLMERGQVRKENPKPWDLIVHRDLKLRNVFLGVNSTTKFGNYPQPKVGDFGLSALIPPNDPKEPKYYYPMGTPGNMAPELEWDSDTEDDAIPRMTSKTNVWGVGIVMWSLLSSDEGPSADQLDFDNESLQEPPEFDMTTQVEYSGELLRLIRSCTRFEIRDRPSFDALLRRIKKHIASDATLTAMYDGTANDSTYQNCGLWLPRADNTYAIGMSLNDLPPAMEAGMDKMPYELRENKEDP